MSRFGSDFKIARSTGECASSGEAIEPGSPCMAVLCDAEEGGFQRLDYSLEAWGEGNRPEHLFSFWKTRVPMPGERQKVFVDDQVLLDIFERLADDDRPQRQAFRYVLGLILIRKRLMRYMGSRQEGEGDQEQTWWELRPKGSLPEAPYIDVLNPGLGDEDIIELSEQLGDVLQGDL
ncbi:MAG: hypothetical protein MK095_01665 [Phycisphaerales bacterium]|nr:hypothetical protein [Phycisphaerales bacterium]